MTALGGRLDRYVLRRMAGIYGLCVLTFVLLFLVVDGFSRLDDFSASAKSLADQGTTVTSVALRFYATKIPRIVSQVGPYLTLFAAIATLLSFARTNELVPMLTAGRSAHRVLLPVYAFSVGVACVLVWFEERVVPAAIRENEILERMVKKEGRVEIGKVPHLTDDAGNRYAVGRWWPRDQKVTKLVAQRWTDPQRALPSGALAVEELLWRKGPGGVVGWYPVGGVLTPSELAPDGRLRPPLRLPRDRPLAFAFTPDDIDVLADSGEEGISRAKLRELQRRFPRQHTWAVELQTRTVRPVTSLVLLLLGIPFVASPEKRSIAWGLGLALGLCVAYFGADFLCRELGGRAVVNPVVAVWIPPVFFTALGLSLMDRVVT